MKILLFALVFVCLSACDDARKTERQAEHNAQSTPAAIPADAQLLVYPDGRLVRINDVPFLHKSPSLLARLGEAPANSEVTVAMSPPPCPSGYYYLYRRLALAAGDREEAIKRCNAFQLQTAPEISRLNQDRCSCKIAVEGRKGSSIYLKVDPSIAADSLVYAQAKIVERRQGQAKEAIGVVGWSQERGVFEVYNQRLEKMCNGTLRPERDELLLDCSKIGTQATGRFRLVDDTSVAQRRYGLAHIDLGTSMLDVAAGISDSELKTRQPSFPDWK